jgi:hypothetical protein
MTARVALALERDDRQEILGVAVHVGAVARLLPSGIQKSRNSPMT